MNEVLSIPHSKIIQKYREKISTYVLRIFNFYKLKRVLVVNYHSNKICSTEILRKFSSYTNMEFL